MFLTFGNINLIGDNLRNYYGNNEHIQLYEKLFLATATSLDRLYNCPLGILSLAFFPPKEFSDNEFDIKQLDWIKSERNEISSRRVRTARTITRG